MIARKERPIFSAGSRSKTAEGAIVLFSSDNAWTSFYGSSSLQNLSEGNRTKGVRIPLTRADYVGLG